LHQEQGARGFSFEIEDAPPEAPNLGRLDLDWAELEAAGANLDADPVSPDPAPVGRVPAPSGAGTPLMPHAAAGRSQGPPRPLLAAFAEQNPESAPTDPGAPHQASPAGAPAEPACSEPEAPELRSHSEQPKVRRLQFPAAGALQRPSPRPSTRFADSVGRSRATADSASDLSSQGAAPPEDLPTSGFDDGDAEGETGPEPSHAAPLLRKAGTLLRAAKGTASELGGRGFDSGRLLAAQMSDALRERLERFERLEPRADGETEPRVTDGATKARVPRRASLGWVKKSAGPSLALAAALCMFIGSRHLLGKGGVELSSTTPAIPDLGELDQPSTRTEAAAVSAAPVPGAPVGPPPPMVSEVVPLPPGMAWPGKGLLEVVTSEDELVYVDGVFTGRGPLRRVPVSPGAHEVSIRKEGSERQGTAEVQLGKTTRALFQRK